MEHEATKYNWPASTESVLGDMKVTWTEEAAERLKSMLSPPDDVALGPKLKPTPLPTA